MRVAGGRINFWDRLAQLGGADLDLLQKTSSDKRQRFIQMTLTLASTAAVAGLSMWYAMFGMVISPQSPWIVRVLIASVIATAWALLIFNLDRILVLSMNKNESIWLNIAVAIPRVAMALLIGAVVSTPLTLQVFQGDIMKMVAEDQGKADANRDARVAQSKDRTDAEDIKNKIQDQRLILQGKKPVASTSTEVESAAPAVKAAQDRIEKLTADLETARGESLQASLLFQCDRYGDPTGKIRKQLTDPEACAAKPGPNGNAPIYEERADAAAKEVTRLEKALGSADDELGAATGAAATNEAALLETLKEAAPARIAALEEELRPIQQRLNEADAEWYSTNRDATGILARLDALEKASASSPALLWAHRLLWWTFAMIEILPVTVKLLTLFGKPTSYDEMVTLREQTEKSRAEFLQREELDALEADQYVRQEVNQDMMRREQEIGLETNELLEQSLRALSIRAARQWEESMTSHYDSNIRHSDA